MQWRPWNELRDELDARIGLTPEQSERDVRELAAYIAESQLAEGRPTKDPVANEALDESDQQTGRNISGDSMG